MSKTLRIVLLGLVMAFMYGTLAIAETTAKPASTKLVSAVCPVMGTKIPDVTKASGKSVYKGKTYYFCCAGCKPQFDKSPEKYIKQTTSATKNAPKVTSSVCPVTNTRIADVTKAAAKSQYKGKTYYFCCNKCKGQFDKDPAKYTNKKK